MFMSDSEMEALFSAVHAAFAQEGISVLIEDEVAVKSGEIDGIHDWSHHPIYDEMVAEVEVFYVHDGSHCAGTVFVRRSDMRIVDSTIMDLPYE